MFAARMLVARRDPTIYPIERSFIGCFLNNPAAEDGRKRVI